MLAQMAAAAAGTGAGDHAGALGNAQIIQQMAQVQPRMPDMLAADATHKNTKHPTISVVALLALQQLF